MKIEEFDETKEIALPTIDITPSATNHGQRPSVHHSSDNDIISTNSTFKPWSNFQIDHPKHNKTKQTTHQWDQSLKNQSQNNQSNVQIDESKKQITF